MIKKKKKKKNKQQPEVGKIFYFPINFQLLIWIYYIPGLHFIQRYAVSRHCKVFSNKDHFSVFLFFRATENRQRIKIFSISSLFVCTWQHNLQSLLLYQDYFFQFVQSSLRNLGIFLFTTFTIFIIVVSTFIFICMYVCMYVCFQPRRLILLLIILYYCHSFCCHWHKLPQLTRTINNTNNSIRKK